jgi:hypothetical protein
MLGQIAKPEPLQGIDTSAERSAQVAQAKRTMRQAQGQQPGNVILSEFYRAWLLESEYEDLAEFTKPLYEGDSFERRLVSYNSTVTHVDEIYEDAVVALALLSSGSLVLVLIMLWVPSYLVSVLLASYPVVIVFLCALAGINFDPVFQFWAPFPVLGAIIFVLQLIFALRYGRPEHRAVEGLPRLIMYRRGLVMTNLGLFFLVGALLMAAGTIAGPARSLRAQFGLMIFGEGGIVLIGLVGAMVLIPLGVREMYRKLPGHVDSTSS